MGVIACAVLLASRRGSVLIPLRWWPLLTVQGALDATAYLTLLLGSEDAASPIAPVIGSTFSVVAVTLARVVLRERMSVGQCLGIALVAIGAIRLAA